MAGLGTDVSRLVEIFYAVMMKLVVPILSSGVAKTVKITDQVFCADGFARVNELKVFLSALGIEE